MNNAVMPNSARKVQLKRQPAHDGEGGLVMGENNSDLCISHMWLRPPTLMLMRRSGPTRRMRDQKAQKSASNAHTKQQARRA